MKTAQQQGRGHAIGRGYPPLFFEALIIIMALTAIHRVIRAVRRKHHGN